MAQISIDIDRENEVTVIKIKGVLQEGDLLRALAELFSKEPTLNTLYDSTAGDWSQNSTEYYKRMISLGKPYSRKGARVAMVFANRVDYGIGRMLESYCELEGYENEHACFLSLEAAQDWLSQADR